MSNILAVDYGTKYIGLALSDETETIADDLITLKNDEKIFDNLHKIIKQNQISTAVVGLPFHENNQPSKMILEIKKFCRKLQAISKSLKIIYLDEFGTSQLAEDFLTKNKRKKLRNRNFKKLVNQKSAKILLQNHLNQQRQKNIP